MFLPFILILHPGGILLLVVEVLIAIMQDARLAGRLHKELKMLQDPPPGVCVWPADDHNLSRLEAQIQGPDGTVYSKGIFKLEVEIPDRYPFEPPNVKFITPVYHPNIDSGGRICHDILNMPPKGQWRPSLNIGAVLASIRVLLEEPNHDDGLMSDISAEYKHNRAIFDDKARRSTERYAMQTATERDTEISQDFDLASASQSTSSKNYALEAANHDTLAIPVVKEVNRVRASKVALDEPSPSNPRLPASSFTPARPRQNIAAKLSLAKGSTSQGVRSCHAGGVVEAELMSVGIEKGRARETEMSSGPGSQIVSQPSELNGSPVVSAGKETSHKPEVAVMELGRERSGGQDADNVCGSDPAICNITKDKQLNTQPFTKISQRTSLLEKEKKLTLPKTKLLKLSRAQPSASESVQESTSTGRTLQGLSHSKRLAQIPKDPVILLDSGSDDEDLRFQARSQRVKRKLGRA